MFSLYHSEHEYQLHAKAINLIADHYKIEEPVIREIYETELAKLLQQARLKTFLSLLTMRHVKEILLR